jgi:hypothetical protein
MQKCAIIETNIKNNKKGIRSVIEFTVNQTIKTKTRQEGSTLTIKDHLPLKSNLGKTPLLLTYCRSGKIEKIVQTSKIYEVCQGNQKNYKRYKPIYKLILTLYL